MKALINNAFNHLFAGDKAELFNGALNFNTTPKFQKIVLKKMLRMIMESSIKYEELSNTQSLISLAQALSNGDSKQFFDEEFVNLDNNLIEKINEAARSLDIEPSEELDIAELYPLAAGSLIEAKLYSLGSLNSEKAASSNIPVHKKIHRINDFREAVAFMAERPNLLVFARIKQFNSNSTARESDSPIILINTGAEILAIDLSNCSDWKAKGIVSIRDKDVNERELTSGDLLAVMFSALINQTNYLDNGKDKECLVFSSTSGSDKKLPAILNAPVAELKPVTPSDIAYSKINPNYEWLDEFIDQELLSSVINLEQSRSESGSLKTYHLTSSRMNEAKTIQLEEVDSYDEYRVPSRAVLLAHNPNAVGTEAELFNKKLEVARFNKAVLASLTIESLWLELNGVGRELIPLLIKAKTKGIFDALAPIIQKEAKEGTRINTLKANECLYQSEAIAFLYKGKGLRGVLENARHEASYYGYNNWNQDRKPFLMINGRKVNKDSADVLKAAKCTYNDRNATHFMAVNLSRYDVLEALINALPIEDESEARELKMKLRAIKYMPEFERQSFGNHTITKKASYPTDRESLEDYIRNPFFEECRLLIPLSNAGVKYLTGR